MEDYDVGHWRSSDVNAVPKYRKIDAYIIENMKKSNNLTSTRGVTQHHVNIQAKRYKGNCQDTLSISAFIKETF